MVMWGLNCDYDGGGVVEKCYLFFEGVIVCDLVVDDYWDCLFFDVE